MAHKLTKKMETFCLEYYRLRNASEAAKIAGYSQKHIDGNACTLLHKPKIQARLGELLTDEEKIRQELEVDAIMSVVERQQSLTQIARADLTEFVNEEGDIDLSGDNTGVISELQVEDWRGSKVGRAESRTKRVKIHSKVQAIDLLNKMDKLYSDGYQDNRVVNRTVNVFVIDNETKGLISRVGERTKLLSNGHENDQSIQGDPRGMGPG